MDIFMQKIIEVFKKPAIAWISAAIIAITATATKLSQQEVKDIACAVKVEEIKK
jgi:hypothetical protein